MKKYTEKSHAKRLIKMMEVCGNCPAGKEFMYYLGPKPEGYIFTNSPCEVCSGFVRATNSTCPCHFFKTCAEAHKQTWIALEEKGYI